MQLSWNILQNFSAPFKELTPFGRLIIVGLSAFCLALLLPQTQPSLQKAFPYVAIATLVVGTAAGAWVWWQERKLNPSTKPFDIGSPFLWAHDIGFCSAAAVFFICAALCGLVSLVGSVAGNVWRLL